VINEEGVVLATNDFYPFGLRHDGGLRNDDVRYSFNGKELQTTGDLGLLDYGARAYDPETERWLVSDPLMEMYYKFSPYSYALNNPVLFIDPLGMDVYRYDDETGEFVLEIKNDDKFDQVGKFSYDRKTGKYTLKTTKDGKAKLRMDNIEKGILQDGINFMYSDNVIEVGDGDGTASREGVDDFLVQLTGMIKKEVAGYYLSPTGDTGNISHVYVSKYFKNDETYSYPSFDLYRVRPDIYDKVTPVVNFHTHPYWHPYTALQDRVKSSEKDRLKKAENLLYHPYIKQHVIITKGDRGQTISVPY